VQGTPTLFVDGAVHLGSFDVETLLKVVAGARNE
jgi:protein-disulfide isomerase